MSAVDDEKMTIGGWVLGMMTSLRYVQYLLIAIFASEASEFFVIQEKKNDVIEGKGGWTLMTIDDRGGGSKRPILR